MRRLLIVALVLCGALLLGGLAVFKRYTAVFPDLPPGVYVGTIDKAQEGLTVPWCVVRQEGEHSLAVGIGDVRVAAQRVAPVDPSGTTRLPLTIGDSTTRLKFTGTQAEQPYTYEGRYFNPISNETGKWQLSRVSAESVPLKTDHELVSGLNSRYLPRSEVLMSSVPRSKIFTGMWLMKMCCAKPPMYVLAEPIQL
jgi:hypothetical protein